MEKEARTADHGAHFLKTHVLTDEGMTVLADRDTPAGSQLFEDYGDNDNTMCVWGLTCGVCAAPSATRWPFSLLLHAPSFILVVVCVSADPATPTTMALLRLTTHSTAWSPPCPS